MAGIQQTLGRRSGDVSVKARSSPSRDRPPPSRFANILSAIGTADSLTESRPERRPECGCKASWSSGRRSFADGVTSAAALVSFLCKYATVLLGLTGGSGKGRVLVSDALSSRVPAPMPTRNPSQGLLSPASRLSLVMPVQPMPNGWFPECKLFACLAASSDLPFSPSSIPRLCKTGAGGASLQGLTGASRGRRSWAGAAACMFDLTGIRTAYSWRIQPTQASVWPSFCFYAAAGWKRLSLCCNNVNM